MFIYIYECVCVYTSKIVWDVQQCSWHAFGKTYHIAISNFHKNASFEIPKTLRTCLQQNPKEFRQMSNESFVVAKRALCRCEPQNQQNSNHPILVDIGWLICIFEFTGQYWYLVICSKTSKDIQYMTSPNCRSFSASTSNSLDRRTASGWLPSSRASETHFFHLFSHYFFLDHHDWDRNHNWKLPWLFF